MPGKMRIVQSNRLPPVPWRNRGGVTREIASAEDAQGILWRISLADVTAEGPFSAFAGLSRISTVIAGDGMVLETDDGPLAADPLHPVRYEGAPPVTGRLPHGPVQNFNLVYRTGALSADAQVIEGPAERDLDAGTGGTLALHVLAGSASIDGRHVPEGATAIAQAARVELDQGARLLAATLSPLAPPGA